MTCFPPRFISPSDRMPETETVDGVPRDFVRIDENGEVFLTSEGLGIQAANHIRAQFPTDDPGDVLLHYAKGLLRQLVADGWEPSRAFLACESFVNSGLDRLCTGGSLPL